MMVQSADVRDGNHATTFGLDHFRHGRLALQRELRPNRVVVTEILLEDATQMPLAEDDHMVETFPTDRTDHGLGVRVLPGALKWQQLGSRGRRAGIGRSLRA